MTPGERLWDILGEACVASGSHARAYAWGNTSLELRAAYEAAAEKFSQVPDGWPEGWVESQAIPGMYQGTYGGQALPFLMPGDERGRRAAWALAGHLIAHVPPDREALARAMHDAFGARTDDSTPWDARGDFIQGRYRIFADEAIRLLTGAVPSTAPSTKIEELEARNATLTATASEAIDRAEKAERELAAASHIVTVWRVRAEEADQRALEAEGRCGDTEDLRVEVARLRHALDTTARAAAHLAHSIATIMGEGDE